MVTSRDDGDYIILSKLDTNILLALARGQMNGYELGRQCEADSMTDSTVSNGALYHSLNSLRQSGLIDTLNPSGGAKRPGRESFVYRINDTGRLMLRWEVDKLQHIVGLAKERLVID